MSPSLIAAAFAQLAEGVIVTDAEGRITFVNDAAARLHGVARLDVAPGEYADSYQLLTEDGAPYPSLELPLSRAIERGERTSEARWRIRRPDGSEITAIGSASPVMNDAGERIGAILTLRDDSARTQAARGAARILEQIADEHLTMDRDFRILSLNVAAQRALGPGAGALIGRTHWEAFPAANGTNVERQYRRVVEERVEAHFSHHYVGEGYDRHLEIDAYPTEEGGAAVFWREVSARVRAERAAEAATRRLAFLANASERLTASLDIGSTVKQVVDLAVPAIADWAIYVEDAGDGSLRILALHHHNPERESFLVSLAERYPIRADEPRGVAFSMRTGQSDLIPEIPDEVLQQVAQDEAHLALLRAVGFRALMTVPVTAHRQVLGAIGFVTGDSGRVFDAEDVALAEELARRAGAAIEHARLFERAEQGERQFRTLADAIPTLAWTAAADGTIDWFNARWFAYTGLTPTQMVGIDRQRLYPPEFLPQILDRWQRSLTSGEPFEMTFPIRGADGVFRRFLTRVMPVRDQQGRVQRWFGTNTDVEAERSAREAAERAAARTAVLQRATEALSPALTREDVAAIVVDQIPVAFGARLAVLAMVTDNREQLTVVTPRGHDMATWQGWKSFAFDAEVPLAQAARGGVPVILPSLAAIAERAPSMAEKCRLAGTNALWVVPVVATAGRTLGSLGLSFSEPREMDAETFTLLQTLAQQVAQALERAALLEESQRARAESEAANATKSQFLSTMSHELRTPLNAIAGYADLLIMGLRGELTEAQHQDVTRIQRANRHLMSLVNDVLNFARLDAGRLEFQLGAIDLAGVIADIEPLIAPQIMAKGLTFDHDGCVSASGATPLRAMADPEKLQQILVNLLTNAVKFTDAPGHVRLSCERDDGIGAVRLRVSDTGRGIPEHELERIFEPFVQVDRHRTHVSQQGVGLGLAISRDLARGMGGDIVAESALGEGSVFTLTIPLAAG